MAAASKEDLDKLRKAIEDLTNAFSSGNNPLGGTTGGINPYKYNSIDDLKNQLNNIKGNDPITDRYLRNKLNKEIKRKQKQKDDEEYYGYDRTSVKAEARATIEKIISGVIKVGDSVTDLIITLQKNQLAISKNSFEKQQKLFQANLQLSQKQTSVALNTLSGFTTQLATDAAFAIYKSSGEEAIAKIENLTKSNIAIKEFEIAEKQRIYEKTEGLTNAIHGIATGALAIGAAVGAFSGGVGLLVGAAVAGAAELGAAIVNWVQKFKKINYEQLEQIKNFYSQEMQNVSQETQLVKQMVDGFDDVVKSLTDYIRENDKFYKQIGATIGFSGDEYSSYARKISAEVSEIFGITSQQMQNMMQGYVSSASRVQIMGANDFNNITATGKLFGMSEGETASLYGEMNIFNTSIESGANMFGEMYKTITKMGLSTSKFTKDLTNNLKLAQKYNFKGGVENMMKLTKWAQQTRFNLNSAASFADSIMNDSLSGALEKSAKLQVLGGSAAMYSDPLGMLYDAGADVGNMAQRMAGMFNDITGTFNKKTGETDFSWYENRMIAARAQALGMDPGEVKNMIRQNNKQGVINRELRGSGLSKEDKVAIGNRATYVQGQGWMVNTLDGKKTIHEVAKMSDEERERVLLPENEEDAIIDIAKNVRSINEREEANKTTRQNEKQSPLFSSVVEASDKNIKAQNIIFQSDDFVANAKLTLESIGNNAITQAESTVKFFNENTKLIEQYRKFVENNIDNTKSITGHTKAIFELLAQQNGNEKLNKIVNSAVIAYTQRNSSKRKNKMEELWANANSDERNYLKERYEEFDEKGKFSINPSVDDGYIKKNGVVTPIHDNDSAVVFKENGPILKHSKEVNQNSNSDYLTVKHEFSGKIELSQDGSTLNFVELIKNNPAAATKFITVLTKMMETNSNGKPTYSYKMF